LLLGGVWNAIAWGDGKVTPLFGVEKAAEYGGGIEVGPGCVSGVML
jgi:hypothetical protein